MSSVWKKIIVLLWKAMILRKRNWILTIFELVSPILLVLLLWFVNSQIASKLENTSSTGRENINLKFARTNQSSEDRFNFAYKSIYNSVVNIEQESTYILYSPTTDLTDHLMRSYKTSVEISDPNQKLRVEGKKSERDLEAAMKEHLLSNYSSYNCFFGIVFSDSGPEVTFKYKVVGGSFDKSVENNTCSKFLLWKLQVYLDSLYLRSAGVNYDSITVLTGEIDQSNIFLLSEEKRVRSVISLIYLFVLFFFLTLTYTFLVTAVVRDTIQEKSSGIKELMKIMGLSSWMIWAHWFIYSMFVQVPVTLAVTVLLTLVPPYVFHANLLFVWLLFLLVTIDYIVIFFCVTCFFDNATKATVLCVLSWIIINIALLILIAVINPFEYEYFIQLLINLIPLINLCWSLQSLDSFYIEGVDWNPSYLFEEGYTGSQIPVGVGIVILICEIILFTLLLAYFDAVKPGQYGVAKSVTFIFGYCVDLWQKRKDSRDSGTTELPTEFELPPPGTKVGIEIRNLHKEFGVFRKAVAVESVNLDIYEGEVTVLLGHNGAGKTTTMSMITGMFSPTSGTVSVDGKNIYKNLYDFRQNLGLCTQHNLYFPKLTVMEHLVFFGMLKGKSRTQAKGDGTHLLHMLNIIDKKNLRGSKLSGGMLRRLCLAVALTGSPKVLILDEPTSGLDPENRRHIWDIILSLRGERTILITTHYMEEADVLGDRIAIMDHGKVVCCGTTMFLKKLYGTGYNIHIAKKPNASVLDITQSIHRHIPQFKTKVVSPSQVDYSVKEEFIERFPDLFSTLESSMSSIGVTDISVSCTTMEDVFLKVAELSEKQDQDHGESINVLRVEYNKIQGVPLLLQRLEALLMKRVIYISKHLISIIFKLIIACLLVLAAVLLTDHLKVRDDWRGRNVNERIIDMTVHPDSFHPIIADDLNTKTRKVLENISKSKNGHALMMNFKNSSKSVNHDAVFQFMNKLKTNITPSGSAFHKVALASTFIDNHILKQYQPFLRPFASSNAANLAARILLEGVHPDKDFQVVSNSIGQCNFLHLFYIVLIFIISIPFALTIIMADFIPLSVEERVTGFAYQQIVAGISPLILRLSNVFCDCCLYVVFIIISLVIILTLGDDAFSAENTRMLFLVLLLYGVSFIIFLNVFSYVSKYPGTITGLYIVLNLVFMLLCPILLLILHGSNITIQVLITAILSLHPTAACMFAIYSIAKRVANDNVCSLSEPHEPYLGFPSTSNRTSICIYVLFLILDTILYSVVVLIIDFRILSRIMYKRSGIFDCQGGDSDVKFETQRVRMYKEAKDDTNPLRVEGLVKNYRSFRAANQVSFLVLSGECFGLLGVNGAGKTTTFKMLTAEITPSSGDAFSTKYSVVSQTQQYLSNIGYCPQFDAILGDFTGKNTLTIIAKIRGIPRKEIRHQVDYWMSVLGIQEHASKPTKTYSGGTKRKLGTAMAFIGEPVVALLDEPTTGVDPAARRKVWSAVKDRQSSGYSAVLSSHSMEECEALCSRLTIMRQGELCCMGSVQQLKTKFGQGYVVLLKLNVTEDFQDLLVTLKKDFMRVFPRSVIQDENINMITFRVLDEKALLSSLFYEALRLKKKSKIVEDFIVSNATLEQLFLAIARGQNIYPV